jgi:hypothetical protein
VLQGVAAVGDQVARQGVEGKPGQFAALLWFAVVWLTLPAADREEEGGPAAAGRVVHDVRELDSFRLDGHADLLLGLADKCRYHGLSGFEVAGGQMVGAIFVAGVLAATEEDLVAVQQEEMDVGGELVTTDSHRPSIVHYFVPEYACEVLTYH